MKNIPTMFIAWLVGLFLVIVVIPSRRKNLLPLFHLRKENYSKMEVCKIYKDFHWNIVYDIGNNSVLNRELI